MSADKKITDWGVTENLNLPNSYYSVTEVRKYLLVSYTGVSVDKKISKKFK